MSELYESASVDLGRRFAAEELPQFVLDPELMSLDASPPTSPLAAAFHDLSFEYLPSPTPGHLLDLPPVSLSSPVSDKEIAPAAITLGLALITGTGSGRRKNEALDDGNGTNSEVIDLAAAPPTGIHLPYEAGATTDNSAEVGEAVAAMGSRNSTQTSGVTCETETTAEVIVYLELDRDYVNVDTLPSEPISDASESDELEEVDAGDAAAGGGDGVAGGGDAVVVEVEAATGGERPSKRRRSVSPCAPAIEKENYDSDLESE